MPGGGFWMSIGRRDELRIDLWPAVVGQDAVDLALDVGELGKAVAAHIGQIEDGPREVMVARRVARRRLAAAGL